jgi:two-component system NtrC family response regulator
MTKQRQSESRLSVLLVDDDRDYLASLRQALESDYEIRAAYSKSEALDLMSPPPAAVVLDVCLDSSDPFDEGGIDLLQVFRRVLPNVPVLMATGTSDIGVAVRSVQLGAVDFLQKGRSGPLEVKTRLELALGRVRDTEDAQRLRQEVEPLTLVGRSPHVISLRQLIRAVAEDGNVTVFIHGETGTGKEVVARGIHANGFRHSGRYVPVVLSAIPEGLVEAALFGSEKGAYTGSSERKVGYAEEAHKGVLFLDEIGEAEPSIQVKLLRFLEQREVYRVGGGAPIKVDVQIIAATNADLDERVRAGRFRPDLYQRLKVFEIALQPLRSRREDIPELTEHFLRQLSRGGGTGLRVAPDVCSELTKFDWPGNVRQLRNAIESAVIYARLAGRIVVEKRDLPGYITGESPTSRGTGQPGDPGFQVNVALARMELAYIQEALRLTSGNVAEASALLGYRDRFTMRRRRESIRRAFPFLLAETNSSIDYS